jgi:hypothetical protein
METPETATIAQTTYNGISILQDQDGFFNVSKLVNHYQPKNTHTARFLKTKKFQALFDGKARALYHAQGGRGSETEGKLLKFNDVSIRMKDHTSDLKRDLRGLYLPREYLDIILMVLDPSYRATVHEVMETVNEVHNGAPVKLTVENSDGKKVEHEIGFDSVRQDRLARSMAGNDEVEYWRMRDQLSDKMF